MAISISDVLNVHAFVPNPTVINPYPVGIWKACRTQVTDGSGGLVRWVVSPQALVQAYKFLWSLEDWSFITSNLSADLGIVVEVYTGEVVSRAGGTEVLRFMSQTALVAAYTPNRLAGTYRSDMTRFIHQPGGGNLNAYIIEVNNVNAQVYTMSMWGFVWNSEARRLASGPRRPLT